ncbi:MAG: alpha/beta hydrolase-fold protein [Siphonobacter sp.]
MIKPFITSWRAVLSTLLLSTVLYTTAFCQVDILIGKKEKLHSVILGEDREYWVHLPANYNNPNYPTQTYPVIYLLDGDSHFHSLTGITQFLSKGLYARMPEMIIVGILNTDRTHDLTPTHSDIQSLNGVSASFPTSGGGETFLNFLTHELIPKIESGYRTNGYRIFTGHSFGGLTVMNTFINHTELFNAYIAIDPSMWWDHEKLLNTIPETFRLDKFAGKSLYLSLAHKELTSIDTTTEHTRAIGKLAELLRTSAPEKLRWHFQYFADEDHGSVPLASGLYGLKFIFEGYQSQVKELALKPALYTASYQKLADQLGFAILPAEYLTDWIGQYCLKEKKLDSALFFFELNHQNYPQSLHAIKVLADAYQLKGDSVKANQLKKLLSKN